MWLTTILIGMVIALVSKYVMDRRKKQRCFAEQGIPGPKPNFIFGTTVEQKGSITKLMEWRKKYGKTFATYEGDRPQLVTSDLDIIKQVYIKDFSNFHSREISMFFNPDDSLVHVKDYGAWKRLRMIVSPTFSAVRMKEMSPLVNQCVDSLLEMLDKREKEKKPFNIGKDIQGLTMTVIARCGFGLDVDALKDPDSIFLQKAKKVFDISLMKRPSYFWFVMIAGFLFPRIAPQVRKLLPNTYLEMQEWFYATAAAIIESRRGKPSNRKDFIQLLLNAEQQGHPDAASKLEVSVSDDDIESTDKEKPASTTTTKHRGMTLKEMQGQCMAFLLAGYETTSTALSFTAYELALHPDVQKKLQQEIDEHFPDDKLPDYLSVQKLPYMDMVFSEVLRLHSIASVVTIRKCEEDWNLNGLTVPKGAIVKVHMEAVHMDPENWGPEDPKEFVPARFLPERKAARNPLAWQPFGGGPRNCVGMRFALMEAKITLSRLLKSFTICKTDETVVPIKVADVGIARPSEGVIIKLERRP